MDCTDIIELKKNYEEDDFYRRKDNSINELTQFLTFSQP